MTVIDKLVNKVKYRIDQLVTDPDAEAAAAKAKRAEHLTAMKSGASTSSDISGTDVSGSLISVDDMSDGQYIKHIIVKTFTIIITTFLALIGGSMAANSAIHRVPIIRILYFIYGIGAGFLGMLFIVNPITMIPSLLLLAGLKYYNYLPHWYAFLPITQTPAISTFEWLCKLPFYWDPADPDNASAYKEKLRLFQNTLNSGIMKA